MTTETEIQGMRLLINGARGPKPKNLGSLSKLEKATEGTMSPAYTLIYLARRSLTLWTSDLQSCKKTNLLFQGTESVVIC